MQNIGEREGCKKIDKCRLCESTLTVNVVEFPDVPLGNNLQTQREAARTARIYPLEIYRCLICGHFQLGHSVDPKLLYATNYTYLTGISSQFKAHFDRYVSWISENTDLTPGDLVLDVGSNDGTCLHAFKRKGFLVCGIDPAKEPASIANQSGIFTFNDFLTEHSMNAIVRKFGKPDLITSHNVLAHVSDLRLTYQLIYEMLAPNGAFCFEVGYFGAVYKNNLFDTIYHEHLDYHHAAPLVSLLHELGFYVARIEVNDIQGGSLRVLCFKRSSPGISQYVSGFLEREAKVLLPSPWVPIEWGEEIKEIMGHFGEIVCGFMKNGKKIAAYGAPTKATLLLAMSNLDESQIMYVVEDNQLKTGRFLPSSSIAIVTAEKFSSKPPDVILILAWNFFDEILEKLSKLISHKCVVITPLPNFKEVVLNDEH